MLIAILLAACEAPSESTLSSQSPPPPTHIWELPPPFESPCRTGCLTGTDGALYAPASESDHLSTPFLRGTLHPGTGQLTWTPIAGNGRNAWRVMHAADHDGDGTEEWLAARREHAPVTTIEVRTPLTMLLQREIPLETGGASDYPTALRTLQDDGDPALEFLVAGYDHAWVFDDDGALLRGFVSADCGGSTLRITLIDTQHGPRLLTCDGVVLDAALQPLTQLPGGVLSALAHDADGDGVDDLLVSADDQTWRLVDGALGRVQWTTTLPVSAQGARPFDLDGDGLEEFVFAIRGREHNGLLGLDRLTGARSIALPMPYAPLIPTALHRFDHDHDGVDSLLVVGLTDSAVFGWRSVGGAPEPTWGAVEGGPAFHNLIAMGDFHPAPGDEIALIGNDHAAYQVLILDLDGDKLGAAPFKRPGLDTQALTVRVGDMDGDGYDELFVRMSAQPIQVLRLHPVVESLQIPADGLIAVGDVNGDGRDDLLLVRDHVVQLARLGHPPVLLPDVSTRSFLHDLDGDGRAEILSPSSFGLDVLDGTTGAIRQHLTTPLYEAVAGTGASGDTRVWGTTYPDKLLVSWQVQGGSLVPAWAPSVQARSSDQALVPVGANVLFHGDGVALTFVDVAALATHPLPYARRPLRAHAAASPDLIATTHWTGTAAWSVP